MKRFVCAATSALLLLSAGPAFAWSDVSGTVKSIDMKTHMITLDNGKAYEAQAAVNLNTFKVGDKVTISTEVENGKNVVNKVTKTS